MVRRCKESPPSCAGGLPIGATIVKQHVADAIASGDHGSTFAGNPLVCHAANTVVDVISDPAFLAGWHHCVSRSSCAVMVSDAQAKAVRSDVCLGRPSRTLSQCVLQPTCVQIPCNMSLAMPGVRHKGERLRSGLREAFSGNPHVKEVRGQGLICGIQLDTVNPAVHAMASPCITCIVLLATASCWTTKSLLCPSGSSILCS
jgi:acetylornithine/succinyldiaminopimelate/putrescine aminotransferase